MPSGQDLVENEGVWRKAEPFGNAIDFQDTIEMNNGQSILGKSRTRILELYAQRLTLVSMGLGAGFP